MMLTRTHFYAVVITPGAVLMALEIVSSRVLAPRFGSSVYVWGSIIGVFLAAMSIGYFWGGKVADLRPSQAVLGRLVLAAGVALTLVLLAGRPIVEALGDLTHGSASGTLLATTALFGPPTIFLAAVSPCAVKLATRDLRLLGGTAGQLYALSTGGSLIGTLGATFVLIPYFDLDSILRLLLAVTAIVSIAAMVPAAADERLTLVLAFSLLLMAVIPGSSAWEGDTELLADRITPYQTLRVSEFGGVRYLHSDGAVHAAVNVENGEPWLHYTRQPGTALLLDPDLESLLVIGMGSGGGGSYLQKQRPQLRIDYVDIDPAIPELARELMFFEDNDRTRVYVDDGRRFLASRRRTRWDYVYIDTYIGDSIPFHLTTVEFFGEIADHLNPGGILGLNLMGNLENPFTRGILRSVHTIFSKLYVFRVPGGNYLFLATDRADAPGRAELLATARRLDTEYSFDPSLEEMANLLMDLDIDLTESLLLTDRYAPVNHLVRMDGSSFRVPAVRRMSMNNPASGGGTEEPEPRP